MIIKEHIEDFYVKEIMEPQLSSGPFSYFLLHKENLGTFEAIEKLAKALHLPMKCFGYAGIKDKRAVTEQYLSIYKASKENVERLSLAGMTLRYVGSGKERISLGDHQGNYFRIVVRDLAEKKTLAVDKMKNLFDSQRFGKTGKNYLIGKAIVKGDFTQACQLLDLKIIENDPIRTLRTMADRRMLRFYISAYQSYLWNQVVEQVADEKAVPVIGFLTKLASPRIRDIYEKLLHQEGVTTRDFLVPKMPELGNEGTERELCVRVVNFSAAWDQDELHDGKYKATLSFQLPKGAYATLVVTTLFSSLSQGS